ncbi:hypothetical protein B7P43_G12986 [Cryptotermes secundus]|uniref:Uncharacterized protein n=1 Tax=Cryptotermes secundus TaxID=105785 RepID=A0A2J7QAY8_9NEOP|nr:hypothetical protein B7P43_G12986 [Cryptotermes secundus]
MILLNMSVWCALSRDRVIVPYFFAERTVTSHNYLDMLQMLAVLRIDDDEEDNVITPRFPELKPLDFCSWVHVKQIVYSVHIHKIRHLKQGIREAAASVIPGVLGQVWQEMEYRLKVRRATNGVHTELR